MYACSFMLDLQTQGLRLKSGSNFIVTIAIDHPEQTARLVVTEPIPPNTGSTGAVAHFLPTVSGDRTFVKWVASSSSRVVKPVKSIPPGLPVFNFFVDNAADGTFTIHADFDSTDAFDPSLEGPRISSIVMEVGQTIYNYTGVCVVVLVEVELKHCKSRLAPNQSGLTVFRRVELTLKLREKSRRRHRVDLTLKLRKKSRRRHRTTREIAWVQFRPSQSIRPHRIPMTRCPCAR